MEYLLARYLENFALFEDLKLDTKDFIKSDMKEELNNIRQRGIELRICIFESKSFIPLRSLLDRDSTSTLKLLAALFHVSRI